MNTEDQDEWINDIVKEFWPNVVISDQLKNRLIEYYKDAFYDGFGAGRDY